MADWGSVTQYLKRTYTTEDIGEDVIKMTFDLGNLRSQVIIAAPAGPEGGPARWLDFHSPVGAFDEVDLERLVHRTIDFVVGGVSTFRGVVTLRASMPLRNLDINEIEEPLHILLAVADKLEMELTGNDTY